MIARGILGLTALVLVLGGLLLSLFIILAGAVNGSPVDNWYFLQADTSNIPGAPGLARWTFWDITDGANGIDNRGTGAYSTIKAARPLDPPTNFGTTTGVPQQFIGTHYYNYMTKSMFAFALVSLFFGAIALFTGLLALCTRLGAYLSSLMTTLAFVFQALQAALMTAAYVKGRDNFRSQGRAANIGQYSFGFEWAAFACYFLATCLFCAGGSLSKDSKYDTTESKGGMFRGRRNKSTRSRGSFINGDKEYA